MNNNEMTAIIEGLLYIWGDPLETSEIARVLGTTKQMAEAACDRLKELLDESGRGLMLHKYGTAYQLTTRPEFASYYSLLAEAPKPGRLTNSSMETLSIIAYKQPITRVEVDNIRGVKSSSSVETLLARGLIEEAGRLDRVGRPILYRTTTKFLQLFELESLEDLPPIEELEALFPAERGHDDENQ